MYFVYCSSQVHRSVPECGRWSGKTGSARVVYLRHPLARYSRTSSSNEYPDDLKLFNTLDYTEMKGVRGVLH